MSKHVEIVADADMGTICPVKQAKAFSAADWKRRERVATEHYAPLLDARDRAVLRRPGFWRLVASAKAVR